MYAVNIFLITKRWPASSAFRNQDFRRRLKISSVKNLSDANKRLLATFGLEALRQLTKRGSGGLACAVRIRHHFRRRHLKQFLPDLSQSKRMSEPGIPLKPKKVTANTCLCRSVMFVEPIYS
jgi:hypothetical protein